MRERENGNNKNDFFLLFSFVLGNLILGFLGFLFCFFSFFFVCVIEGGGKKTRRSGLSSKNVIFLLPGFRKYPWVTYPTWWL